MEVQHVEIYECGDECPFNTGSCLIHGKNFLTLRREGELFPSWCPLNERIIIITKGEKKNGSN